ncbi:MAG: hypothetical protein ACE5I2_08555, partial [Anaerolineae bacterium]
MARQESDARTLREMYEDQELSIMKIARRLHRDPETLRRALQQHGIRLRTRHEVGKIASRPAEIRLPRETLVQLYEVERLSARAIRPHLKHAKRRRDMYEVV